MGGGGGCSLGVMIYFEVGGVWESEITNTDISVASKDRK